VFCSVSTRGHSGNDKLQYVTQSLTCIWHGRLAFGSELMSANNADLWYHRLYTGMKCYTGNISSEYITGCIYCSERNVQLTACTPFCSQILIPFCILVPTGALLDRMSNMTDNNTFFIVCLAYPFLRLHALAACGRIIPQARINCWRPFYRFNERHAVNVHGAKHHMLSMASSDPSNDRSHYTIHTGITTPANLLTARYDAAP
jgi:hypothetical protein